LIDDYRGFYQHNRLLSWVLALALFSLAGIPPTAGFFGKLFLITAGASKGNYFFITVAALNLIISLYYYLRVIRAVFMDKNEDPIPKLQLAPYTKAWNDDLWRGNCAGGAIELDLRLYCWPDLMSLWIDCFKCPIYGDQ
jgi:hypothetical protein